MYVHSTVFFFRLKQAQAEKNGAATARERNNGGASGKWVTFDRQVRPQTADFSTPCFDQTSTFTELLFDRKKSWTSGKGDRETSSPLRWSRLKRSLRSVQNLPLGKVAIALKQPPEIAPPLPQKNARYQPPGVVSATKVSLRKPVLRKKSGRLVSGCWSTNEGNLQQPTDDPPACPRSCKETN